MRNLLSQIPRITAVFLMTSMPSFADEPLPPEDNTILNLGGYSELNTVKNPNPVDVHAVIAIDVSGSVKLPEMEKVRGGVGAYLTSDEALLDYASGSCKQISILYFARTARFFFSAAVCNEADASAFAENLLSREEIPLVDARFVFPDGEWVEGGTSIISALQGAEEVFAFEERDLDIVSDRRVTLVMGDDLPTTQRAAARRLTQSLAEQNGAKVCGIVIGDFSTAAPSYRNLHAQETYTTLDSGGFEREIKPCEIKVAEETDDIVRVFARELGALQI